MVRYLKWLPAALFLILILVPGCKEEGTPKPRGYFRIGLPTREYRTLDSAALPYVLDYPVYARIQSDPSPTAEPYWINISYPEFKARIHMTYKTIDNNLYEIMEDNVRLVYSHVVKAEAIDDRLFSKEENKVFGIVFQIRGDAASPVQFFATDSVRHFLRGALYFQSRPNKDSLAPVVDFITQDIFHLVESIRWKKPE
jgi:gliding motility-associated lipoprotein GldD